MARSDSPAQAVQNYLDAFNRNDIAAMTAWSKRRARA